MMGLYPGRKPGKEHDNPLTGSSELKNPDNDSDLPLANQEENSLNSDLTRDQERIDSRSGGNETGCDSTLEQHEVEDRCDSEDDEGWITPENFHEVCVEMGGALEEQPMGIAVGCITTDFAMQVRSNMLLNCAQDCCKA